MMTIDAFRHRSFVAPFVPGKRYNVLPLVLLTKRHLIFLASQWQSFHLRAINHLPLGSSNFERTTAIGKAFRHVELPLLAGYCRWRTSASRNGSSRPVSVFHDC